MHNHEVSKGTGVTQTASSTVAAARPAAQVHGSEYLTIALGREEYGIDIRMVVDGVSDVIQIAVDRNRPVPNVSASAFDTQHLTGLGTAGDTGREQVKVVSLVINHSYNRSFSMKYLTNRLLFGLLKATCAVVLTATATAGFAADTPMSLAGATLVTAEQAKKLADGGTPIIDARVANEYAESHIKGAKSVPYKEKSAKDAKFVPNEDSFDLAKLPADKTAPVIFYCNGPECWKGYKASKVALDAGYKKVQWLRLGIPEWKAKGYPVE
jgi:rhodanese-related sulfurtransferase